MVAALAVGDGLRRDVTQVGDLRFELLRLRLDCAHLCLACLLAGRQLLFHLVHLPPEQVVSDVIFQVSISRACPELGLLAYNATLLTLCCTFTL